MEIALSPFIFRYCNKNNHTLAGMECHPLITPVTDPCRYKLRYTRGAWRFFSRFLNNKSYTLRNEPSYVCLNRTSLF